MISITPNDIQDPDVKRWFIETKSRRWLIIIRPLCSEELFHSFTHIDPQNSILLLTDCNEELIYFVERQNRHNIPIVRYKNIEQFCLLLDKENINSYIAHASFSESVLDMRRVLLSDRYFSRILPIWYEGGFLRYLTYQYDWLGWNAWSSLAQMDIRKIPNLNEEQDAFLEFFMQKFLRCKEKASKRIATKSKEQLHDMCKTSKNICLAALQKLTDSTITVFASEQYKNREWAFRLSESNPDVFFIIKDHPKQDEFDDAPKKYDGPNWLYLPHDSEYDTQTMAMHSDVVATVNSTVGCEALYWTPVVTAGDSVYTHKQICHSMEDFSSYIIPKKREDINKFLYYAITQFHFTPSLVPSRRKWFNMLDEYRKEVGPDLKGKISLPDVDPNWYN